MSSSQNLETTLSKPFEYEVREFEKFGMAFRYGLETSHLPEYKMQLIENDGHSRAEWVYTGGTFARSYVKFAAIKDHEHCQAGVPIEVFSTADGPLLAICIRDGEDAYELLDPCVIQYDGKTSRLTLAPIFNVARKLRLFKSAVRAVAPPLELVLAAYPGFLINNRMANYYLKLTVPLTSVPVAPAS